MMDAADCIVTKPGGLTTSESLAKALPMIIINPIPGQEERNAEFLLNNGLALMVSETFPVDEAIYQLINSKWRLEASSRDVQSHRQTKCYSGFMQSYLEFKLKT